MNAWKTIPIRRWAAAASARGSETSTPSRNTWPSSISSSRSTQRSSVDLPDPDDPMSVDDPVLLDRQVDPAQHGRRSVVLDQAADLEDRSHARPCRRSARAATASAMRRGDREQHEQQRGHHVGGEVEGARRRDLRGPDRVHRAEHGDQPDVLLQRDEVVEQQRRHPAHGLREDHGGASTGGSSGPASAPRRAGRGGSTRCRRGTPRPRTRSRRGSA